jgi:hypothetical protein
MSALCQKQTHAMQQTASYSITSSARPSSVDGTTCPSSFAALRLMTNSNFVGCSTGISPGFVPRRILVDHVSGARHSPYGNQQSCGWTQALQATSPRRCAQPRGFLGVPPPDGGKSCRAVFRHQIGMAEAIPSRAAHIIINYNTIAERRSDSTTGCGRVLS